MRPASDAEHARLGETFSALCAIPSPSGQEDACAEHVREVLERMGVASETDHAGNLIARIPPPGHGAGASGGGGEPPWVLFCAHLDTVPLAAPVEPVVVDGGWENANDGILGADNKAAVAVCIELARRARAEGAPVGIELAFTRGEEIGLVGAKALDRSALRAAFGFVFDSATPLGGLVMASPTSYRIEAEFRGKSAHAGLRPEDGHSAIRAAAQAVSRMPHGRLDEETTANVGDIRGGDGATNVVPDRCRLLAETRSIDPDRAEQVVAAMVDALQDAAADGACDVDVTTEKLVAGYRLRPSSPPVIAAEAALRARGFEPRRVVTGGGSDVNALVAAGLPCVNLSNGTERNHEPTERISVVALEASFDVALALLDESAAVLAPAPGAATPVTLAPESDDGPATAETADGSPASTPTASEGA